MTRDVFVSAIARERDQRLAVPRDRVGIRAGVEQHLHRLEVTLTHREMQRLVVAGEIRIAREERAQRRGITGAGGDDGVPDVAAAAAPGAVRLIGREFVRLNQIDGAAGVRRWRRRLRRDAARSRGAQRA